MVIIEKKAIAEIFIWIFGTLLRNLYGKYLISIGEWLHKRRFEKIGLLVRSLLSWLLHSFAWILSARMNG
jgi:hypothetical protein